MQSKFTATEGQTTFNLAINLYTDLDNIINLLHLSSIGSINENNLNQKVVNYDTDLISDNIMYKHIFSKKKRFNTGLTITSEVDRLLLGTNSGYFIITNPGYKILI